MHKLFRIVGYAEGLSFLYLLGVAMPQKYVGGDPRATMVPGAIHGALVVAYLGLVLILGDRESWPRRKFAAAVAASILPLGTFVFDRRYLRAGSASAPADRP